MSPESRAVLVVEDDADGLRALHVIEQHEPAADTIGLILLDVMLPFLSGVELIRGLADYLSDIPVVAISGSLTELAEASAAGATDVLAKPFSADALLSLVARHWPPPRGQAAG